MSGAGSSPLMAGVDLVDPDLLYTGLPHEQFAALRRTAPIWWNEQPAITNVFDDGGFWAVTKHSHVAEIARDHHMWSAHENTAVLSFPAGATTELVEGTKVLLTNYDPPDHTRLRKLVSRAFTPRAMAELEVKIREAAVDIVERIADQRSGDFVEDVAGKLPLRMIADLLGIPQADRDQVYRWSNAMTAIDDDNSDEGLAANVSLLSYAYSLAEERRKNPTNDVVSNLVHVGIDGDAMTEGEFGLMVLQMLVAGHETTRNAITQGLLAFLENPPQWELFTSSRPPTTADEVVRYSCPLYVGQRTATHDVELGGVTVRQGQRVGIFWASANFDDTVFADPMTFDITRSPNPHLGFGTGVHVCLGAHLARREIAIMFETIADRIPNIRKLDEPQRLRSALFNGVSSFTVAYR